MKNNQASPGSANIQRLKGAEAPHPPRQEVKTEPRYTELSFRVDQKTLSQKKYSYRAICMLYHSTSVFDVPNGLLHSLQKNPLHITALYIGMVANKDTPVREHVQDPSFRECAQGLLDLFIASGHAVIDPNGKIGQDHMDAMARKRERAYDSVSDADLASLLESFDRQRNLLPERIERSDRNRHEMVDAIADYFGRKAAATKS
jgi:hypothetical protein